MITLRNLCIALTLKTISWATLHAQIILPNDYFFKLTYKEIETVSFEIDDDKTLSDLDKLYIRGSIKKSNISKYFDKQKNTWTHKIFTLPKGAEWLFQIEEILITPKKIITKTNDNTYNSIELPLHLSQLPFSDISFLEKMQFPNLAQIDYSQLQQLGISVLTNINNEIVIDVSANTSIIIDEKNKITTEITHGVDEHQNSKTRTKTTYFIPLASTKYLDTNGTIIFTEINPLWIPGKIVHREYDYLPSGATALKVTTLTKSDIHLKGISF